MGALRIYKGRTLAGNVTNLAPPTPAHAYILHSRWMHRLYQEARHPMWRRSGSIFWRITESLFLNRWQWFWNWYCFYMMLKWPRALFALKSFIFKGNSWNLTPNQWSASPLTFGEDTSALFFSLYPLHCLQELKPGMEAQIIILKSMNFKKLFFLIWPIIRDKEKKEEKNIRGSSWEILFNSKKILLIQFKRWFNSLARESLILVGWEKCPKIT